YPNVWLGASVERKKYMYRLDDLRSIPCVLRYADNVGMLEDVCPEIENQLTGIVWCVTSGEKGCGVTDPLLGILIGHETFVMSVSRIIFRFGSPMLRAGGKSQVAFWTVESTTRCRP